MGTDEAKAALKELVDQFSSASKNKDYLNGQNEEWIKWNFLEPLMEKVLGWKKSDIEKEKRILKGRADYMLKLGNEEVLVVEAKKAGVNLSEDEGRQAVSYAYHRKVKLAIVSNFREIKVYHALTNIKNIDHNLIKFESGGYFRFTFEQFLDNFDKLMFLSRENFENKSVYKLVPSKIEKASKPIDESILHDLLQFRDWLSKDLKKTRMQLTKEQIDEVVQMLIDRLIFMRSVEDRGLESANFLLGLMDDVRLGRTDKTLWSALKEQFKTFDKSYNSKLFAEGLLEREGFFDEQTLIKVIRGLYFGTQEQQARYMFDEIPGDLLGNIYEQYLGTILQGTEKRVKLDEESGKRKKMGIYYTPSYIVDYIVRNTVGEYIKNKNIDEILEVKIVDPACGSGSFIVRAFQEVCNAIEDRLKKGEKGKMATFQSYKERLSFGQKISILTQCIYGVDLDEKAVELAQLNLLLKLLEDESSESHKRLLPNLRENIKCGNSLIDDYAVAGDKAFKWEAQFKEVFKDEGFDVVIGNPPYIRIQSLDDKDVEYFNKAFVSPERNYDIYILFIEKGHNLLKPNGKLGFILPNKFLNADYGKNIRSFISDKLALNEILDFRDYQIFESATTYTCLLFLTKEKNKLFTYSVPIDFSILNRGLLEEKNIDKTKVEHPKDGSSWSFSGGNKAELFKKLNDIKTKLSDISSDIFQGMVTGADRYYFVKITGEKGNMYRVKNNLVEKEYLIEKEVLKKLLKGKEIRRWFVEWDGFSVIYPYDLSGEKAKVIDMGILKEKYPSLLTYFKDYEKELKGREEGKFKEDKAWYRFGRTQNIDKFKKKKIMTQVLANSNKFSLDEKGEYYFVGGGNAGGYGIILNSEYSDKYKLVLSLLNSKTLEFYLKCISTNFRGGYYSYGKRFIERFPIIFPDKKQENKIIELTENMLVLANKLHELKLAGGEKDRLEQQINNIDYELNQEVYKLYGITKEEQKVIEESLK